MVNLSKGPTDLAALSNTTNNGHGSRSPTHTLPSVPPNYSQRYRSWGGAGLLALGVDTHREALEA